MRCLLLTLCVLCFFEVSYAQKPIDKYNSCSEFETYQKDGYSVTNLAHGLVLKQKTNQEKANEFFEIGDTAYRTYLQAANTNIMVDSLVIRNYDQYSIAFQVQSIYHITHKTDSFAVIRAFDAYQFGTEAQSIFIVFKLINGQYNLFSVYMVMEPEKFSYKGESVKVYFSKKELLLRGSSLVLLRSPNWIK